MKTIAAIAGLALALASGSAFAAASQEGLVNVKTGDIGVPALNNTTVQVPIGIAAQVCGVDANVIAKDRDTALANCTVTQTSANKDFMNFIQKKTN
ncbi:MAG TPA: hypothetical protein VFB16_02410 [Bauldia sp.]|nr:hypothetical protein [Bauldia sp.]